MPIATFYDIQRYYRYNMWDNKSVFLLYCNHAYNRIILIQNII